MEYKKGIRKFKPAKYFRLKYNISASALRNWSNQGKIETVRHPGGKRIYNEYDIRELVGETEGGDDQRKDYIYARVSTSKQKEDLDRQVAELKQAYPNFHVITDIASGINFKRRGLLSLLEKVNKGMVRKVVCMHKDRLARFSADLLEYLFKLNGVEFLVHRKGDGSEPTETLAQDLLAITTVFVSSYHGKRAAENKRKRSQGTNQEEARKRQKDGSSDIKEDKVCTTPGCEGGTV